MSYIFTLLKYYRTSFLPYVFENSHTNTNNKVDICTRPPENDTPVRFFFFKAKVRIRASLGGASLSTGKTESLVINVQPTVMTTTTNGETGW